VRKALALAGLAGLAGLLVLTACGKKAADSAQPSAAAPTTTPAAPTGRAPAADGSTLGPDGAGGVKLGATAAEVEAAGLYVVDSTLGGKACPKVGTFGRSGLGNVQISTKNGVSVITAGEDMRTPEGVKLGSPLAAVKKAYPQLANSTKDPNYGGENKAPVPGNPKAVYRIFIINDKVVDLDLRLGNNDCAGAS
jgi:hypothetical protein